MLKKATSRVMWVGRASVFLVGLAVILGVTVGLGSAAVAAAPSQPGRGVFRLAATNTAQGISSLVGNVARDAVLLVNNGGGGPALDLRVEPGQAPMKVNSGAKVTGLNADQVDGLDAEELRGEQGPPGAPGISGYQIVRGPTVTGEAGERVDSDAVCPDGKKVIGGGATVFGPSQAFSSGPVSSRDDVWRVTSVGGPSPLAQAVAICANVN